MNIFEVTDLKPADALRIMEQAETLEPRSRAGKGQTLGLFFNEQSTRTRLSFTKAAQAMQMNVLDTGDSRINELSSDVVQTLGLIGADIIVVRFPNTAMRTPLHIMAEWLGRCSEAHLISGGHCNSHPTQAWADYMVMRNEFSDGSMEDLTIAYVGKVGSSRVAQSHFKMFAHFGEYPTVLLSSEYNNIEDVRRLQAAGFEKVELRETAIIISKADIIYTVRDPVATSNPIMQDGSANKLTRDLFDMFAPDHAIHMSPGPTMWGTRCLD